MNNFYEAIKLIRRFIAQFIDTKYWPNIFMLANKFSICINRHKCRCIFVV